MTIGMLCEMRSSRSRKAPNAQGSNLLLVNGVDPPRGSGSYRLASIQLWKYLSKNPNVVWKQLGSFVAWQRPKMVD